jgi:hypothetical protein
MHGLNGIHDHIQDDLLQLNSVAIHAWQSIIQSCINLDVMFLEFDFPEGHDLHDNSVDIDGLSFERILFEQRADVSDDVGCAMTGRLNVTQGGSRLVDIYTFRCKPMSCCACPCYDHRQRLLELVSEGC